MDRLGHLENTMNQIQSEISHIRSSLLNAEINEVATEEKLQQNSFMDPVLQLISLPITENVYIGPSAVISKVHAIRKFFTNDKEINVEPLYQMKHKAIEEVDSQPPSRETEELFKECYLTFSRNRYHFIEKSDVLAIFEKHPFERTKWETFITYIVLANGSRMAELSKMACFPSPKFYFDKAFEMLSHLPIISLMQQIQVCMTLALYLHYSYDYLNPFVMNVWELSGMAIRKVIQLGYHKKKIPTLENCVQLELEKRLFWSTYAFDRLLSLSLGRPASISNAEIDVPYPLSLENLNEYSASQILEWQTRQLADPTFRLPVTSLTYLEETCKIRELESRINILAYGKDNHIQEEIDTVNHALEEWLSQIPSRKDFNDGLRNEVPFDYLLLLYHRAKLFLLLPQITSTVEGRQGLLQQILVTCGGICRAFKNIQKNSIFGFSIFSLHTIFLAGVALVYCVWAMGRPPHIKAHNDIRICSNLLYSFSERASEAEIYRVLFENLVESTLYNDTEVEEAPKEVESNYLQLFGEFDDEKLFNFTFDDDFWKRLDFT